MGENNTNPKASGNSSRYSEFLGHTPDGGEVVLRQSKNLQNTGNPTGNGTDTIHSTNAVESSESVNFAGENQDSPQPLKATLGSLRLFGNVQNILPGFLRPK